MDFGRLASPDICDFPFQTGCETRVYGNLLALIDASIRDAGLCLQDEVLFISTMSAWLGSVE